MAVTWAVQWPKAVYWRDAASQTAFEFETADFIPGNSAGEVPNTSNQSAFGTIEWVVICRLRVLLMKISQGFPVAQ